MLEHRPVAMPADAGARIVADEQRLGEVAGRKTGKTRCACSHVFEKVGDRQGRRERRGVEIVAPAK